jgi:subtilisin family serine protease
MKRATGVICESLETRCLMAWSAYAKLVNQDTAAATYPTVTGKGATVAVIDTGIDYTQAALGGGFGKNYKVIGGYDFYANDSDPMDESGHGTSVASVIAANKYTTGGITYQGVAPDAKLVALRVGTETSISDNDIERALQWVLDNRKTYNITVVNMSIGSGSYTNPETDSLMSGTLAALKAAGVFVVAASGNSNDAQSGPISQDGIAWPAADPSVFAVGAVDSSDVIASWAQRGDELDLLAPGVNITMIKKGGGYVTEDGTSFSSPYVAGTAALLKQADPSATPGDIGSVLMTSGKNNRDGDLETGNTTTLQYSRLDISAALSLAAQRIGRYASLNFGATFDTALDSDGVLHAVYYDKKGRLLYTARDTSGLWSKVYVVDDSGNVGSQLSIAVDHTGKIGVAYYDATNSAVKYAEGSGATWTKTTVESAKSVGQSPSLAYDIDGNAYIAYYRKTSGDLRLARLNRDSGAWTKKTIDGAGAGGADVGSVTSLDVGEAAVAQQFGFTTYHTTVAIAYADNTNGKLKYARLDLDDPTATWYISNVDTTKAANINLNLHYNAAVGGLQAQIVYQDTGAADVRYAYRNTDWFVETVKSTGKVGDTVQLYFDSSDRPTATYYDRTRRALYTATRTSPSNWSSVRTATSAGPMSASYNERTGETLLSYLNRTKTNVFSTELI